MQFLSILQCSLVFSFLILSLVSRFGPILWCRLRRAKVNVWATLRLLSTHRWESFQKRLRQGITLQNVLNIISEKGRTLNGSCVTDNPAHTDRSVAQRLDCFLFFSIKNWMMERVKRTVWLKSNGANNRLELDALWILLTPLYCMLLFPSHFFMYCNCLKAGKIMKVF